jgi:hypothetical protein
METLICWQPEARLEPQWTIYIYGVSKAWLGPWHPESCGTMLVESYTRYINPSMRVYIYIYVYMCIYMENDPWYGKNNKPNPAKVQQIWKSHENPFFPLGQSSTFLVFFQMWIDWRVPTKFEENSSGSRKCEFCWWMLAGKSYLLLLTLW